MFHKETAWKATVLFSRDHKAPLYRSQLLFERSQSTAFSLATLKVYTNTAVMVLKATIDGMEI